VNEVLIYTEKSTERVNYACELVFRIGMHVDFTLTTSKQKFTSSSSFRINYSISADLPGLHIVPNDLLQSSNLAPVKPEVGFWNALPVLFPSDSGFYFDIFAAVFFMVSRYEEYCCDQHDAFNRFPIETSTAFEHGFLNRPIVDEWVIAFRELLMNEGAEFLAWPHRYRFTASIDVDSAFAYCHKGGYRTTGALLKDVMHGRFKRFGERIRCLTGRMTDPYDTFSWLHELHRNHEVNAVWFFLLADFGSHDKGVPHSSRPLRERIREADRLAHVGIHPGVGASKSPSKLVAEVQRLAAITSKPVVRSRQHYLCFELPAGFRRLEALEIEEDWSMGCASQVGFRAGTSRRYPFFDVLENRLTNLQMVPFAAMDATLNRYLNHSPNEAIAVLDLLAERVKQVDGEFVILWHNETVSEKNEWKGWRSVYEHCISKLS